MMVTSKQLKIPVLFSGNIVQTINVTIQSNLQSSLAQSPYISIFGYALLFPSFDRNPKTYNLTPRYSDVVVNIIYSGYWIINSFTTFDGKVHTADNLNY